MKRRIRHYRHARYRALRKPINKTVLIAIISAAVILAVSIALGLYLSKISAPDPITDEGTVESSKPEKKYGAYKKIKTDPVSALPLPEAAYGSDEDAAGAILRASGELAGALCVKLLDGGGAPSYKSEVYSRVYSAEPDGFDLKAFAEKAAKSSIKTVGVFSVFSFGAEYADVKAARQAYEISLLSEAYSYGAREVILTGLEESSPAELYSFMKALKRECPELAVGILLSAESASDTLLCAELDDIFDFISFDLTASFENTVEGYDPDADEQEDDGEKDEAQDTEQESEPPKSELYLEIESLLVTVQRFGARAYIDVGDGCEHCLKTAKSALTSLGVENYMLTLSAAHH